MCIRDRYMYAFLGGKQANSAYMIFRVQDVEAAEQALAQRDIKVLDQDQMAGV